MLLKTNINYILQRNISFVKSTPFRPGINCYKMSYCDTISSIWLVCRIKLLSIAWRVVPRGSILGPVVFKEVFILHTVCRWSLNSIKYLLERSPIIEVEVAAKKTTNDVMRCVDVNHFGNCCIL